MKMVKPLDSNKLTERNQITLLKNVRDAIGTQAGETILFYRQDHGVLILNEGIESILVNDYQEIHELTQDLKLYKSKTDDNYLLFNHAKGTLFLLEKGELDALIKLQNEI